MATILVCDDDKDIVEAISIYLEQEGHQILKAYDGQQALLVLQKNEVDLLIIDAEAGWHQGNFENQGGTFSSYYYSFSKVRGCR